MGPQALVKPGMMAPPTRERLVGILYRAHNPRWSYAPSSGAGAARHGGRFNRRGTPALYTALDPKTAWMEAQQGMPFKAQPLILVAYHLDCEPIADLTDPAVLANAGIDPADLACAWEDLAARGIEPPSWRLADDLLAAGFHGAIVPSFAPGTAPTQEAAILNQPDYRAVAPPNWEGRGRNLVLWTWSAEPPCRIEVIDDFGRLPKNAASWR